MARQERLGNTMHISEGILSGPVLLSGGALAAAGTAVGLKSVDYDEIARVGLLSAVFFVASLIHIPVGPASAHLIMNGMLGLLLGWAAFPAILVALVLQGVFFQFGGITTLGVNTIIMALPAVACRYLFAPWLRKPGWTATIGAFGCGCGAVLLGTLVAAASLLATETEFTEVASLMVAANLPVMVIEGFVTAFAVTFLMKVQPGMLPSGVGKPAGSPLTGGST
jgi:cobalt/nickel transport system permease protein